MTNEELDRARSDEAYRIWLETKGREVVGIVSARLAREGWTPPEPVDPDIAEAQRICDYWSHNTEFRPKQIILQAIKRGRALAAAEAKSGLVWVKHDGSRVDPVGKNDWVWIKSYGQAPYLSLAGSIYWANITHYAVITPPEDVA